MTFLRNLAEKGKKRNKMIARALFCILGTHIIQMLNILD